MPLDTPLTWESEGEAPRSLKIHSATNISISETQALIKAKWVEQALLEVITRLDSGKLYFESPEIALDILLLFEWEHSLENIDNENRNRMILSLIYCLQEYVSNTHKYESRPRDPQEYTELRNRQQRLTDISHYILWNMKFDTDIIPFFKNTNMGDEYFSETNIHTLLTQWTSLDRKRIQNIGTILQVLLWIRWNNTVQWNEIFSRLEKEAA